MIRSACNELIVRLFDYAAGKESPITARQAAEYTGSSLTDARSDLELLRQGGYLKRTGNGMYVIPTPKYYRGQDVNLLRYKAYLESHPVGRKAGNGSTGISAEPAQPPNSRVFERRRKEIRAFVDYVVSHTVSNNCAVSRDDIPGISDDTWDHMEAVNFMKPANGSGEHDITPKFYNRYCRPPEQHIPAIHKRI